MFGGITVLAGIFGTIAGSELSKLISRKTEQADCIVCAIGLLGCSPFLFLALTLGNYNMYISWVSEFKWNLAPYMDTLGQAVCQV